jgi:hypothetical protein
MVWQYPQKIGVSCFIDLGIFAFLLAYSRLGRKPLFWIAVCGLTIEAGRYVWAALTGTDTTPLYVSLRGRNFFAFIWQFIIPTIYVLTFLTQMMRKDRRTCDLIVMAASLLGIAVKDSTITNHYTHSLPLVIILTFWIKTFSDRLSLGKSVILKSAWMVVLLIVLMTNNLFLVYPNIFNFSGINWGQVKEYYHVKAGKQ